MTSDAPVNFPPDPNPRELRFTPPPGTCDSHFHIFGPPHLFPYQEERQYTPPAAPIEHFLALAAALGIERGVLTPSFSHGLDTSILLHGLAKGEGRLRGMMWADPALDTGELERLYAAGVCGIRFNFVRRWNGTLDPSFVQHILSRLGTRDWVVDFFLTPDLIEPCGEVARTLPFPVVIDHFGGIDGSKGVDQPQFRALLDVLGEPNVWVKISGANRVMARGARYEDVVPFARALIARAPDRIVWGTDWPHTDVFEPRKMVNDGDLMNMLLDFAPDEGMRRKILADNPARLFGFA
jgi:predicted TIM-barrel fold metal-dependent hydrolase